MAKKDKSEKTSTKAAKIVTIKDLEAETGIEPRKIRMKAREIGLKAPEVESDGGFGPKSKYEWPEGHADLKKLRDALAGNDEDDEDDKPKAKKTAKAEPKKEEKAAKGKGKKKAEPEPADEDEDEDEDEDDEDDE